MERDRRDLDAARRAGIRPVRFHDLRHTHAAWLISAGVPLPVIQKYLNFHYSVSLDLFGSETSTNVANYYTAGIKGRWMEERRRRRTELTASGWLSHEAPSRELAAAMRYFTQGLGEEDPGRAVERAHGATLRRADVSRGRWRRG